MDTKSAVRLLSETKLKLIVLRRYQQNMQTVVKILKVIIIKLIIYLLNKTITINFPQFNTACFKNTSNFVI